MIWADQKVTALAAGDSSDAWAPLSSHIEAINVILHWDTIRQTYRETDGVDTELQSNQG